LDPKEVEAFVDGMVTPALQASGVPGAVVVVVRRAGVILSKGYGVADIARQVPLRADVTLLDVASIGKSMTAVITEQLLDEGILNLDENVDHYLKSTRISGPKVTLRMLLGHRGGFDDDLTALFVPLGGDTTMSRNELDRRLTPLVTPGYVSAYDNQGFGVVGLILTDVTGKSFSDLYRERLFEPTGMTGAVQGEPADGSARLAHCYTVQGPGNVRDCEYWLYRDGLRGAGGVAASGADMARYMRMLLNGGTLDGRRVLSERAYADLTNFDSYRFHAGMPGLGRSFTQFEEFRGLEYGHGGSMPGFSSLMKIYPDADVGIFVGFLGGQPGTFDVTVTAMLEDLKDLDVNRNALPGLRTLQLLPDTIAEHFIPANRPRSSEGTAGEHDADDDIGGFLGRYILATAHSRSLPIRINGWMNALEVRAAGQNAIELGGRYAAIGTLQRIAPLLYEGAKGKRLAFARLATGRYLALGLSGGTFRKTDFIESPAWTLPVLVVSILVVFSALIQLRRKAPAAVRQLAASTVAGFVLVSLGMLAECQWGVTMGIVRGLIWVPAIWRLAILVGAAAMLWGAVRFWWRMDPALRWIYLVHGALMACAAVVIPAILGLWRVVGAFPPYWGS
jgi:CubicO group peptidase (beta-lactamase class C family)